MQAAVSFTLERSCLYKFNTAFVLSEMVRYVGADPPLRYYYR